MTSNPLITAVVALIGVLLGGGIQAYMQYRNRKVESASVLQALLTEVHALVRLCRHRGYLEAIALHHDACVSMVAAGKGEELSPMLIIDISLDYFKTYDALVSKIGTIEPWYADRVTRFYLYLKAVAQNYVPTSPFHVGMSARSGVDLFGNDIPLLQMALRIGDALSNDRKVSKPRHATDSTVTISMTAPAPASQDQAPNSGPSSSG